MDWTYLVLVVMFIMHLAEGTYVSSLGKHLKDAEILEQNDLWLRKAIDTVKELHAVLWGICIMLPILLASKWSVKAEVWTVLFIAVLVHMYIDKKEQSLLPIEHGNGYVICIMMVVAVWLMWIFFL